MVITRGVHKKAPPPLGAIRLERRVSVPRQPPVADLRQRRPRLRETRHPSRGGGRSRYPRDAVALENCHPKTRPLSFAPVNPPGQKIRCRVRK